MYLIGRFRVFIFAHEEQSGSNFRDRHEIYRNKDLKQTRISKYLFYCHFCNFMLNKFCTVPHFYGVYVNTQVDFLIVASMNSVGKNFCTVPSKQHDKRHSFSKKICIIYIKVHFKFVYKHKVNGCIYRTYSTHKGNVKYK